MKWILRCLVPFFVLPATVRIMWENPDDAIKFGMPVNFTAQFKYFNDLICQKVNGQALCVEENVVGIEYVRNDAQNASHVPVR